MWSKNPKNGIKQQDSGVLTAGFLLRPGLLQPGLYYQAMSRKIPGAVIQLENSEGNYFK